MRLLVVTGPRMNTDVHRCRNTIAELPQPASGIALNRRLWLLIRVYLCPSVANYSAKLLIEPQINTDGHRYEKNINGGVNFTFSICVNPCPSVAINQ